MGTRRGNGMGTIVRRGGGRDGYKGRLRYTDPDGIPAEKWFYGATVSAVEDKRAEYAAQIRKHGRPTTGGGSATVAGYLAEWVEVHSRMTAVRRGWSNAALDRYRDAITGHALPYFESAGTPLARLRLVDVTRFALALESKPGRRNGTTLSASSRTAVLVALRHALDDAARPPMSLIPDNPARFVALPQNRRTPDAPRRALGTDEAATMLAEADAAGIGAPVQFLYLTGARVADAANLSWSDIEFDGGSIRVTGKGGKTRTLTITPALVAFLRAHRKTQAAQRLAAVTWNDPDAVFTRGNSGERMTPGYLSERIRRRCSFSAHYLRHTYVTRGLAAGVPLADMAAHVGHTDTGFMLNHYAHGTAEGSDRIRAVMDDALGMAR